MSRSPARWLMTTAKDGIADAPANVGWLLRKAFPDQAGDGARQRARRARDAVADSVPIGTDSLQLKVRDAHNALERARRAEREAVEAAQRAKDLAGQAEEAATEGRRRRAQAEKDLDAEVERRVKDARRRADEAVERERAKAEDEASKRLRKIDEEIAAEDARAQTRAEQARARAQTDIDAAAQQMADARRLADEAAQAAQQAADDAHRQAQTLADEAKGTAAQADERVAEVERIQDAIGEEGAKIAGHVDDGEVHEDLDDMTKRELLDLATTIGIEQRSTMNKTDLVKAIRKAEAGSR